MKRLTLSISTILVFVTAALAQMTAFTYQGKLTDGGSPPTGQYDFVFRLYDQADIVLGTQIGSDVLSNDVQVTAGIFTVNLDFGASAFTSGADRYLQISVRPGTSTGAYTPLAPLQPLTSSPFSIRSLSATSADSLSAACVLCVSDGHIVSIDGSKVTGTVNNAATATNVSGVVQIANGGTGSATQNFVDLTTNQSVGGDKRFSGAVGVAGPNGVFNGNGSQLTNLNGANLQAGSVNAPQIGALAITSNNLGDGSVLTNKISDGAVTAGKIGDGSVLTNKILDGAVTKGKIAAGVVFRWNVTDANQQTEPNNGYVNNSSGEVILNLPTAPQVGDIIRVACANDGGFRFMQNPGQSITFSNADINADIPNLAWIPRDANHTWQSVASSADGTKLVAVDFGFQIYTSTNSGVTWTPRETNRNWSSVASSADGTKLVAVVNSGGQIYTSTDSGSTWTPQETNRNWVDVASSADGTRLVAVVANGQIYTSVDSGVTWTPRDSNRNWRSVASSEDGTKLVAVVAGIGRIYTSADSGVFWIPRESFRNWSSVASSADGTKLVAVVNGGQIYTSTDSGSTWTPQETNRNWVDVASSADGTRLVAVVANGQIYTSVDSGVTWTPRDSNRNWRSVASSEDGIKLVAVVNGGQIYVRASASTVGVTGGITGGNSDSLELIYIGAGKFLILSQPGGIALF